MPEGDVLRRTATRLDEALAGEVLVGADLRWPDVATTDLTGRTVLGTRPYGKHLLTRLDDGRTLHTHLRMDGTWRVVATEDAARAGRGPQVRAVLVSRRWTAVGRLLGMVDVLRTRDEHQVVGHLGPDVLDADFDASPGVPWPGPAVVEHRVPGIEEAVHRWEAQGSRPVAEVLLDQRVVAGIGTIFMAESLFALRWWPWTPAERVDDPGAVLRTARALMRRSVVAGRPDPQVHGRYRRPCVRCGAPLRCDRAGAPGQERPVFWCRRCQTRGATRR